MAKTALLVILALIFLSFIFIVWVNHLENIQTIAWNKPAPKPVKQVARQSNLKDPCPKVTVLKKKGDGILRSQEEQNNEAIQILTLAVESAVAKHSRKLSNSRCDWTDGYWVKDTSIVYGKGTLSGYGKCRVDSRQNCKRNKADAPYLGFRWVLNDRKCEENRIRFTKESFLEAIRGKKVAFIGDSLTRNMFQSLACLLYSPKDKKKMIEDHAYRYRYPEFSASIEFIVSNYLVKQTRKNCDSNATVKVAGTPCLDIYQVDEKWANRIKEFDVVMFATGGWWEHDLQMRQASKQLNSYHNSRKILTQALKTVMGYLRRPEFKSKQLFWRCSEVSHFFDGEWNTGGTCRRDAPSNVTQYNAVSLFIQEAVVHSLMSSSSNITLFDISRMSSYRQDAHPSSQARIGGRTDCKHWCLPGVPDHWNEIWLNMLAKRS